MVLKFCSHQNNRIKLLKIVYLKFENCYFFKLKIILNLLKYNN